MGLSERRSSLNDGEFWRKWQIDWDERMNPVRPPDKFSAVLESDRGKEICLELGEIIRDLCDQQCKMSPNIVERLGSACEKLAQLTDFPFAVGILEHRILVGFLGFLSVQRDRGIVLNRFTEADRMYKSLKHDLLVYFGNKVVEQNRLLAVPAGDTSNAVAEIMGSLHTP